MLYLPQDGPIFRSSRNILCCTLHSYLFKYVVLEKLIVGIRVIVLIFLPPVLAHSFFLLAGAVNCMV